MHFLIKSLALFSVASSIYAPIKYHPIYLTILNIDKLTRDEDKTIVASLKSKSTYNDVIDFDYWAYIINAKGEKELHLENYVNIYGLYSGVPAYTSLKIYTKQFEETNPIECVFRVTVDATQKYITEVPCRIYEYKDYDFDISTLIGKGRFENPYFDLNIANNKALFYTDYVNFDNWPIQFELPYYHDLDLSTLQFTFESDIAISYDSCQISFVDTNNIFPYLSDAKKRVTIPLKISKVNPSGNIYSFSFANKLFVNSSNEISFIKRTSFKETNTFYLPIGKKDIFEKYNLSLKITGLGRNKIDYHYNFNYVTNNNLVGSCNDSSYCIIGGMR